MTTAFHAQAAEVALRRMFRPDGYFDICVVDGICKALNRIPPAADYNALRLLHCVHWRDMVNRLARTTVGDPLPFVQAEVEIERLPVPEEGA